MIAVAIGLLLFILGQPAGVKILGVIVLGLGVVWLVIKYEDANEE